MATVVGTVTGSTPNNVVEGLNVTIGVPPTIVGSNGCDAPDAGGGTGWPAPLIVVVVVVVGLPVGRVVDVVVGAELGEVVVVGLAGFTVVEVVVGVGGVVGSVCARAVDAAVKAMNASAPTRK